MDLSRALIPSFAVPCPIPLHSTHPLSPPAPRVYRCLFISFRDCVRKTYANHGLSRFYRGAALNALRMGPNTAVQFGSYELLKGFL